MHRNSPWLPPFRLVLASLVALGAAGCAGATPAPGDATAAKKSVAASTPTKIVSFAVSNENLNVDKVGLRDGFMKPDGNRDLAFTGSIDGPFEALFIVSTNAKGEPGYGLHSDTLTGQDEVPAELGGVVDTGKMTVGIGVVEDGKFINGESGSAQAGSGVHNLKFYVPNTATLRPGSFVRLYARAPGGALVPGPITPY